MQFPVKQCAIEELPESKELFLLLTVFNGFFFQEFIFFFFFLSIRKLLACAVFPSKGSPCTELPHCDLNPPYAFDFILPIIHLVPSNLFLEESANTCFVSSSIRDSKFSIISHLICLFFRLKNLSVFNLFLKQSHVIALKRIMHQGNELGMLLSKHGTIRLISPQFWNF